MRWETLLGHINKPFTDNRLIVWFLPVLLLAITVLLICPELVTQNYIFALGDVPDQFLPWREFVRQSIAEGRIPLWNRFSFCGAPFLANMQSCVLYPLDRFMDLLFPAGRALSLGLLLHLWMGGMFLYALALHFGASRWAALVSGVGYALGGFHAIHLLGGNLLTITSSIYLPAHLLALSVLAGRVEREEKVGWCPALAVLCGTLQILSGHAQMVFYNAVFVGTFLLIIFLQMRQRRWRLLGWLMSIGMVSFLLAAPQILPTLEYSRFSSRTGSLPYDAATEFSFGWEFLASLFLPEYLGTRADVYTPLRMDTFWGDWKNWSAVYVGILPAIGFLWIVLSYKKHFTFRSRFLALLAMGLAGLFLSLGKNNLLYPWIHSLPLFGQFRAPSKFLPGFIVPVAVLGAVGLSQLREFMERNLFRSSRSAYALGGALVGVAGFAAVLFLPAVHYVVTPFGLVCRECLRSLSLLLIAGGILSLSVHSRMEVNNRKVARFISLALVILSILDLGIYFRKYAVIAPPEVLRLFPVELVQKHLQAGERVLATPDVPHLNETIPAGIPTPGGYDPFQVGVYMDEFRRLGIIQPGEIPDAWTPPIDQAVNLSAGLVVTQARLQSPNLIPVDRDPNWFLYRVRNPKPFVEFIPEDSPHLPLAGSTAEITLTASWNGERLLLRGFVPMMSSIIIRQTYVPGWQWKQSSGGWHDVQMASPFWQSIEVESGTLNTELRYRPKGWIWGLRLHPLGLIGLCVIATMGFRWRLP